MITFVKYTFLRLNSFVIIFISITIASIFTWLLYATNNPWSKTVNYILSVARFVAVAVLVWVILAPDQKQNITFSEKPIYVIAIDNSKSVVSNKSTKQIEECKANLFIAANKFVENGFDVKVTDFKKFIPIDSIKTLAFNARTTDLSSLLNNIRTEFDGQNIGAVLLVSDGIFNVGSSPLYENYTFPIHTIGFGDTIKRQDLAINRLKYNRIVSSGNKFPIVAEIKNVGFQNQDVEIKLLQNNQVLDSKSVRFSQNESLKEVEFVATASKDKILHFVIQISPKKNENTLKNNVQHIYIEVIDSKTEILIVAASPHPDLKALELSLNQNQEYATTLFIPEISTWVEKKYDLVIFHQIPNGLGIGNNYIEKFKKQEVAQWYFVGNQSSVAQISQVADGFKIMSGAQSDKVQGEFASSFEKFTFDAELKQRFSSFPPLFVPFGEYNLPGWENILLQKVGSVVTNKPILSVNTNQNPSQAVWVGEGLWQWRLIESSTSGNATCFDQLILKTSQLLVAKKDKRKFRFVPIVQQFDVSSPTQFECESLNDIFEKITGNEISLTLTHESKKKYDFTFTNTNSNPVFQTNGLAQGVYKYVAKTKINNKEEIAEGSFSISETDFEFVNTLADFEMLKKLSETTKGNFYLPQLISKLENDIIESKKSDVLHSIESYQEVISIRFLLLFLVLLLIGEWTARKYLGKQ